MKFNSETTNLKVWISLKETSFSGVLIRKLKFQFEMRPMKDKPNTQTQLSIYHFLATFNALKQKKGKVSLLSRKKGMVPQVGPILVVLSKLKWKHAGGSTCVT